MKITLKQLIDDLQFKCLTQQNKLGMEVNSAYVSDLLSDVMGKAQPDMLWITSQVHKNIVAVASLKELSAIVVVNERQVEDEVIEHANEEGVTIIISGKPMFETAGLVYNYLK
ncbi:conserved hypothetical protein [uncultured Paludibacter sp.]|nr:conserved hypothetical protein [uncultured Paludibacter sp.]